MLNYQVVKLDQRYKGAGKFKWAINFDHIQTDSGLVASMDVLIPTEKDFVLVRNWCWEVFGPSQEIDYFECATPKEMCPNGKWSWFRSHNRAHTFGETMIYLENDNQLTMFKLKWA